MNAHQAREIATRANTESEVIQYKKIKSLIDREANKGNFELWYYAQIEPNTINILEGEGFHVTITTETQTRFVAKITW